MSSQQKIDANRENAQKSTGPSTPEGRERSSQNAKRHGFTGKSLLLTDEEMEQYEAHVRNYFDHYQPYDAITIQLTQQLADGHWSVHQIFVEQSNLISMINEAKQQLKAAGDAVAALTTIAPFTKMLQTYTLYEQRRRRAADAIEQKLQTLLDERVEELKKQIPQAAKIAKVYKAKGQPFDPADLGFVCSIDDVEAYLQTEAALEAYKMRLNQEEEDAPEGTSTEVKAK